MFSAALAGASVFSACRPSPERFAVAIRLKDASGGERLCSGALIAQNLVLTARHCVSLIPPLIDCSPDSVDKRKILRNLSASVFHVTDVPNANDDEGWPVRQVHYPDEADCTTEALPCRLCGYDIAVLELDRARGKTFASPASVAPSTAKTYDFLGYGQTTYSDYDSAGRRKHIKSLRVAEVFSQEVKVVSPACVGDSGGPLYDPRLHQIVGVLSRSDEPSSYDPGCSYSIMTRVDRHMLWLQQVALSASARSGTAPPAWAVSLVDLPPAEGVCCWSKPPPAGYP